MQYRKEPLVTDQYYHIFSRSISKFIIFNNDKEYQRMLEILQLYKFKNFDYKFSRFTQLSLTNQKQIIESLKKDSELYVEIIAYCLMPTHIHLILKQTIDGGISNYLAKVLNSYSRFFNTKHHRSGPLWDGRFKSVLVSSDEQLLHLTRYLHLNPTSIKLIDKPEKWHYSSFLEYINDDFVERICSFTGLFDFASKEYKKFVLDRKAYQQELSIIKNLLIEDYSG